MRRSQRLLFASALITTAVAIPSRVDWALAADNSQIQEHLERDLKVLASDAYEGRGLGTNGIEKAATYIEQQFEQAGLDVKSAGGDPYQEFEVLDKAELGAPNTLTFGAPLVEPVNGELDSTFRVCSFSGSGHVTAPIVFVGYGIESKEPEYDDFAGIEVRGKAVLILRRTPQQGKKNGLFAAPHGGVSRAAELRTKISNAYRAGAVAVLIVNDEYTGQESIRQLRAQSDKARDEVVLELAEVAADEHPSADKRKKLAEATAHWKQVRDQISKDDPDPLIAFGYGGAPQGDAIPVFHIKRELADKLLKPAIHHTLADLEQEIDDTGKPHSQEVTGWTLDAEATVKTKMMPVKNVIGVLEGKGALANETVIVGAHYDHLGFGGEGSLAPGVKEIHNGADDNGSGSVALLELARQAAAHRSDPSRRLVFIAFTGEERGLLGSAEYVKAPVFPLESTVAMINLDMVGRLTDDKLTVFGAETARQWNAWLDRAGEAEKLTLVKKPEGFGPSDHSSFYARNIPVLHLFTGVHSDYHRPGDDVEKINFEGLARIVAFASEMVRDTATSEDKPEYVQVAGQAQLDRTGSRPYFGSIPDFGSNEKGYAIQGVSPGSPAEKGGVKAGDVIIRLGEQNVGSLDDFDLALRKFNAGQQIDVTVRRQGQEVPLKVTLEKPRS
jgi:hypothetical protein